MRRKKSDWKFGLNHSVLNLPSMLILISFYLNFEKQPRFYHYVARKRRHKKFVEAEIIGIDPSNLSRLFHFDAFLKLGGASRPLSFFFVGSAEKSKIRKLTVTVGFEFSFAFVYSMSNYSFCRVLLYYTVKFEAIYTSWINFNIYKYYKITKFLFGRIGVLLFHESVELSGVLSTSCVFVFRYDGKI